MFKFVKLMYQVTLQSAHDLSPCPYVTSNLIFLTLISILTHTQVSNAKPLFPAYYDKELSSVISSINLLQAYHY